MATSILTVIAIALFIAGLFSLRSLGRLGEPTDFERADPFFTPITLLFSTLPRSREFRRRQRLTIWLFCVAVLVFFVARNQ